MLYLASALQKTPGKDVEVLMIFREALAYYEGPKQSQRYGVKSELWARANYACLLRKMGEDDDAREQEKKIRPYPAERDDMSAQLAPQSRHGSDAAGQHNFHLGPPRR